MLFLRHIFFFVALCGGAGWVYLGLPYIIKRRARRLMADALRRAGCVCLTFDDGPDPRGTPAILDLLARADARATFFLLGRHAEAHPELVRRIRSEGHEVAEHGYGHVDPWSENPFALSPDLRKGRRALSSSLPANGTVSLRPPYGRATLSTLLYALCFRRRLVFWNVNPVDDRCATGEELADRVRPHLAPGAVVLMHDARRTGARRATSETPQPTIEGLRLILDDIQRLGLRAVTVREAFEEATDA